MWCGGEKRDKFKKGLGGERRAEKVEDGGRGRRGELVLVLVGSPSSMMPPDATLFPTAGAPQ